MIEKKFVPHRLAIQDEEEIIRYYERTSTEQITLSFINALDEAFTQLSRYPQMGSPRPEYELDLQGIRSWTLRKFPHQIYYEIQRNHIELWRIIHPKRNLTQMIYNVQTPQ